MTSIIDSPVFWVAAGVIATVVGGVLGWLWRLSDRTMKADAKAEAAADLATRSQALIAQVQLASDTMRNELNDHKVSTARDYVSYARMESLENKLINAIDRLGDRFDKIIMHGQSEQ